MKYDTSNMQNTVLLIFYLMSFLPGEVVASQYTDLGVIEQHWHTSEFDYSFVAGLAFETRVAGETHDVRAVDGSLRMRRFTLGGRNSEKTHNSFRICAML